MNLIELIKYTNHIFHGPPVQTELERRNREREIIQRYSTGNISLQCGKYITEADVKKRRSELCKYKFFAKETS